jgi:NAD(P)-dependent dehydrogenase (short-subunit alcohol dehydrogenase family)
MVPFSLSAEGIELQFATNHVGHFLLTRRLLDVLLAGPGKSRIVNVSSEAHRFSYKEGIYLEADKLSDPKHYGRVGAYGQSKLANILFTKQLVKLLKDKEVLCNVLHPGAVDTSLGGNSLIARGFKFFLMDGDKGAITSLYAATSPEIESKNIRGEYFVSAAFNVFAKVR